MAKIENSGHIILLQLRCEVGVVTFGKIHHNVLD